MQEHGFQPDLYQSILHFYARDENSTAIPSKRDTKSINQKLSKVQKRVLNYYLSNLIKFYKQVFLFKYTKPTNCIEARC